MLRSWMESAEHPDLNLLAGFSDHRLRANERAAVLLHASACERCRRILSFAVHTSDPPAARRKRATPWLAVACSLLILAYVSTMPTASTPAVSMKPLRAPGTITETKSFAQTVVVNRQPNRPRKTVSAGPLPRGRASVNACKYAITSLSRARQQAVCSFFPQQPEPAGQNRRARLSVSVPNGTWLLVPTIIPVLPSDLPGLSWNIPASVLSPLSDTGLQLLGPGTALMKEAPALSLDRQRPAASRHALWQNARLYDKTAFQALASTVDLNPFATDTNRLRSALAQ
jgi:hypothetical protein